MTIVKSVYSQITGRKAMVATSCAVVLLAEQWFSLEEAERFSRYMLITTCMYLSSAWFYLLAILAAAEWVARGAPPLRTYLLAWLPAALLGGLVQAVFWFQWAWRSERSWLLFWLENALEVGTWGALAMLLVYNQSHAERMSRGVREAELKYAQLQRELIDSRLEAARRTIDAPTLFADLGSIANALKREEPGAIAKLEATIDHLRSLQAHASVANINGTDQ